MPGYLSLDIICSSKLTVFLELRSRKTVSFSEQIMSADKYPSIFSRQMKAIVYLLHNEPSRWKRSVRNDLLPGNRYLNLVPQSDHRAEISGHIVWYEALAKRPQVLRSFSSFYAHNSLWVLFFTQSQVS